MAECGGNALFQPALLPLCCGNPLSSYESRSTAEPNQRKKRSPQPKRALFRVDSVLFDTVMPAENISGSHTHTHDYKHTKWKEE